MFYKNLEIIYLQQVLIYGCPRRHMIFLFLWLISWDLIGSLNKWLLGCLKQPKFLVKPYSTNLSNFINRYELKKKLVHMWKMKGQFNYNDNCFEINC